MDSKARLPHKNAFRRSDRNAESLISIRILVPLQGTDISTELILFRENASYVDTESGLHYTNAFDMGVDAFTSAIAAAGYPNLEVIVGEAGKILKFLSLFSRAELIN